MPVKRTTILRWTGRGSLSSLRDSVGYALRVRGVRCDVSEVGHSVIVRGPEPIGVASLLQHMPGIAWIAAGRAAGSANELASGSASLARAYLRRGYGFSVHAEGTGGVLASDVSGAVTSKVLETVKGARVSESPRVRFRVAVDGREGAVGVEVRVGDGGVPTGEDGASCLVSGGRHSSVVAWMAVLAGYRVRLVHAKVSEGSVLAVARLYSELSNRADPRGLSLEVIEGGSPQGAVVGYAPGPKGGAFAGFHAGGARVPAKLRGKVSSPLYLMPEETYSAEFESLGVRAFEERARWGEAGPSKFRSRTFAGGPVDVSGVLDGLS